MGLEPFGHNVRSHRPIIVSNAFMASVPGHLFMQELIDAVFYKLGDQINRKHVLESTGPFMVTELYKGSKCKEDITLLPASLVSPLAQDEVIKVMNRKYNKHIENKIEKSYAIHYFLGSWYR